MQLKSSGIVFSLLTIVASPRLEACQCGVIPDAANAKRTSAVVFAGTASSIEAVDGPGGGRVTSAAHTSCDLMLCIQRLRAAEGRPWLVFGDQNRRGRGTGSRFACIGSSRTERSSLAF
jgi:hypothetical protein